MKRRNFFGNLALGTASTLSLSRAAHAQENQQECTLEDNKQARFNWVMATSWPEEDNITFLVSFILLRSS